MTIGIATVGASLALRVGLPSPWLLGAMLGVLLATAARLPVFMPSYTAALISLFLGISIASNIQSDLPQQLREWRGSLLLMLVMLALLLGVLYGFYRHRCAWSKSDALLSAIPGNLAIVMIFAAQAKLSASRIALVHSVRLFFLVTTLPLLFPIVDRASNTVTAEIAWAPLLLAVVSSAGCGWLAQRCRVPAGMLIGALIATLLIKFGLGLDIHIPSEAFRWVLVVLGAATAVRMADLDMALLRATMKGALGGLVLAISISGGFALLLHFWFDLPLLQALLAYMPGGLEVMVAIAFSVGADPVFVATHQLARMLLMCFALPLLFMRLNPADKPSEV